MIGIDEHEREIDLLELPDDGLGEFHGEEHDAIDVAPEKRPAEIVLGLRGVVHTVENQIEAKLSGFVLVEPARLLGNGVDQEDVERIFEPYYSTKKLGIGMGLVAEALNYLHDFRPGLRRNARVVIQATRDGADPHFGLSGQVVDCDTHVWIAILSAKRMFGSASTKIENIS